MPERSNPATGVARRGHVARTQRTAVNIRTHPRLLGRVALCGIVLSGVMLAGCSVQVPRVEAPRGIAANAEADWTPGAPAGLRAELAPRDALAFLPDATERSLDGVDPSAFAEYARNDARTSPSGSGVQLATSQWPTPERPSLERQRRIYVGSQNTFLIFLPEQPLHGRRYWR
ncbi:MAG: hypothetical protein K2X32_13530 [Phycisphaerales bacterium]|nr:hypothetical protein [Phycisphaerales bacterium]